MDKFKRLIHKEDTKIASENKIGGKDLVGNFNFLISCVKTKYPLTSGY